MKKIICFLLCFIFCFSFMVVPSLALSLEEVPEFPAARHPEYVEYIIVNQWDLNNPEKPKYVLYLFNSSEPFELTNTYIEQGNVDAIQVNSNTKVYRDSYVLWYNAPTVWNSVSKDSGTEFTLNGHELVTSTVNIYDESGNLFFQATPVELFQMIQEVTNQEMMNLPTALAGVMKILTLCGVGCLALLMVFPLFGKVLRIFHLR